VVKPDKEVSCRIVGGDEDEPPTNVVLVFKNGEEEEGSVEDK